MQGNKLGSSRYLGCDDECTEFVQLLVVEDVFHPQSIILLSLHWACSAGLGRSFEPLGPNSAPNSNYTEVCALSASEIRIWSDLNLLNLQQLPWLGVYLLSKTGNHWLKPKSGGQRPWVYCLPFGSREGLEVKLPNSAKATGAEEPPEKSREKLGHRSSVGRQWKASRAAASRAASAPWKHRAQQRL